MFLYAWILRSCQLHRVALGQITSSFFYFIFTSVQNASHRITSKTVDHSSAHRSWQSTQLSQKGQQQTHLYVYITPNYNQGVLHFILFFKQCTVMAQMKPQQQQIHEITNLWITVAIHYLTSFGADLIAQTLNMGTMHQSVMLMNWVTHFLSKVNMRNLT